MAHRGRIWRGTAAVVVAVVVLSLAGARAATVDEVRARLQALDEARQAGILSDAEYQQKKAQIQAELQRLQAQPDEATRRKLEALDGLLGAGLVSREDYERKKAEILGQQRTGQPPPASQQPAVVPATLARAKGTTYRHPLGFTMWQPEGWTVKLNEGFLQLVPPGAGGQPGVLDELYLVLGESVEEEGVTTANHPTVIAFLDQQIRGTFPALQRVGDVASIETAKGQGIALDWEGKSPQGDVVRARVYANIIRGHGVALVGVATKAKLAAREPVLRQMFASFGIGEGHLDRAVVGTWRFVSAHSLSNEAGVRMGVESAYTKAQATSERRSVIELRPDGTWKRTDVSTFLAMGAYNPVTGTPIVLGGEPETTVSQGRWNAGSGRLYLMSDKNSWEEYRYEIVPRPQGRVLKLAAGKSCDVWTEQR